MSLYSLPEQYFADSENGTANAKTEYFLDKIERLYNKFCPIKIKSISHKNYTRPWITCDLKSAINHKHALFKRYKQAIVPFQIY